MIITEELFESWCTALDQMVNPNPEYVPTQEEINELFEYTKKIRTEEMTNMVKKTGRPLKSDLSIYRFIKHGPKGSPYITEADFFKFLLFISEKAEPVDMEGKENLRSLNKYLRENLIIE